MVFLPPSGLMGMPGDSSQQARTACSYQHSPSAGSSGHHQHNHGQASHHPHHPQQHLSPHSTHSQHQAHSQHGQHQQHPAHSQQHPSLSHQSHTGQTCPTTGEIFLKIILLVYWLYWHLLAEHHIKQDTVAHRITKGWWRQRNFLSNLRDLQKKYKKRVNRLIGRMETLFLFTFWHIDHLTHTADQLFPLHVRKKKKLCPLSTFSQMFPEVCRSHINFYIPLKIENHCCCFSFSLLRTCFISWFANFTSS